MASRIKTGPTLGQNDLLGYTKEFKMKPNVPEMVNTPNNPLVEGLGALDTMGLSSNRKLR
jgi:hypothetical protein